MGGTSELDEWRSDALREACLAWQSGRDTGSTPIRAAARYLTGIHHFFSAPYIEDLDRRAVDDVRSQAHARSLLDALSASPLFDAAGWGRHVGALASTSVWRGMRSNPVADDQIEAILTQPDARFEVALWSLTLSAPVAERYGRRFLFEVQGAFPAIAPWVPTGVKANELELISAGRFRVIDTSRRSETLVVRVEHEALPGPHHRVMVDNT